MRKKSCQKDWPQFPEGYDGVQVNCCKFITCDNFGIDPEEGMVRHLLKNSNNKTSKRQPPKHHLLYTTSGTGKNEASVVCKSCKKAKKAGETRQVSYTMKSNKAVNEEYQRIASYLMPSEPKCPNIDCSSNTGDSVPLSLESEDLPILEANATNACIAARALHMGFRQENTADRKSIFDFTIY